MIYSFLRAEKTSCLAIRDLVKFSLLVALSAIFIDATIAHGLFWENDPYWTYWITKTFLIASVFSIGIAYLGISIGVGALLALANTLCLEIYYQWFAPIGLPQEPEWLDFNHIWITGVPTHFLAVFSGFLIALWVWRRAHQYNETNIRVTMSKEQLSCESIHANTLSFVMYAMIATVAAIFFDCIITQLAIRHSFPGVTYFIHLFLVGYIFILVWNVFVGLEDLRGLIIGSLMLALVWIAYDMYLGALYLPSGLPYYLKYNEIWYEAFPGAFISALIALWLTRKFINFPRIRNSVLKAAIILLSVSFSSIINAQNPAFPYDSFKRIESKGLFPAQGLIASAEASGQGKMVVGPNPTDLKSTVPMEGSIKISTNQLGIHWSHVQNISEMNVVANFTGNGSTYHIEINKPMPRHPLGSYTTWGGVVYLHNMHGGTKIGTDKLPRMMPDIALWGWATVTKDGTVISKMAPAHVMVLKTDKTMQGIILEVSTEDKDLIGVPDGYLTVMWPEVKAFSFPMKEIYTRQFAGWSTLFLLVLLFLWLSTTMRYRKRGDTKSD